MDPWVQRSLFEASFGPSRLHQYSLLSRVDRLHVGSDVGKLALISHSGQERDRQLSLHCSRATHSVE